MGQGQCHMLSRTTVAMLIVGGLVLCFSGCAAQMFSATQQVLNFVDVLVDASSDTQTITLVNNGDAAFVLTASIQPRTGSPDGQFTITGGTCTRLAGPLQTGDTCTYTVQAMPTVFGAVSGVLTVTGNAEGLFTSQPVVVNANGAIPKLAMYPPLDFGNVAVGAATPPPQILNLVNLGTVPAYIAGASISIGPGAPRFSQIGGNCYIVMVTTGYLAPGQTCTFAIITTPTKAGAIAQQFVLAGANNGIAGSAFSPASEVLVVNGVLPTLPPSPALKPSPTPSSPAQSSTSSASNPSPSPRHHHHSG